MVVSDDKAINERIIELRKKGYRILRLHKWLSQWNNYKNLDEQIILAHVLNILNKNNLPVRKSEVRKIFNKYYNQAFHGQSRGFLNWMFNEFNVGKKVRVFENSENYTILKTKEAQTREKIQQIDISLTTHKNLNFPIIQNA